MEHEASTSKIGEDQLFYFQQRGIDVDDAVGMIISGFCREVFNELPLGGCCAGRCCVGRPSGGTRDAMHAALRQAGAWGGRPLLRCGGPDACMSSYACLDDPRPWSAWRPSCPLVPCALCTCRVCAGGQPADVAEAGELCGLIGLPRPPLHPLLSPPP